MHRKRATGFLVAMAIALTTAGGALASSHREAPFITKLPKVDGTDLYMFRSFEENREGFVTLLANYIPLQDPYGGPNYFFLDPEALYEIHIDNNGDAVEDITFQFRPQIDFQEIALEIGDPGSTMTNNVPLYNVGPIENVDDEDLNIREDYTLSIVRGDQVSALTWDDIDFFGERAGRPGIFVRRSQVGGGVGLTKTGRERWVPLHPTVKAMLVRLREAQRKERVRALVGVVFPSRQGTYRFVACLQKPLARCAARAGIKKHVTTHCLRHTANNLLRQEGGSVVAKAIIGHATDGTHEHYSSVTPEEAAEAILAALG